MRPNKTTYKAILKKCEFHNFINDNRYVIQDIDISHAEIIQIYYSLKVEMVGGNNRQNVVLAAFVTAHARIRLHKELHKLGSRVIYCDTDSIIFKYDSNGYNPTLDNFLGGFTNEIDPKDGTFIVEIVTPGPKTYATKTNLGVIHAKVKGITLNHLTELKINFDSMLDLVKNDQNKLIFAPQVVFKHNKKDWIVKTENINKMYRFCVTKVVVLDDLTTRPFGF
jgi:hypothetical protein